MNHYKEHSAELSAIILDFDMPVMSGIDAAASIRAEEKAKGLKRLPIIGLTGYANEEMKRAALLAGMDTVMTKPILKKNLVGVLDSLIMNPH